MRRGRGLWAIRVWWVSEPPPTRPIEALRNLRRVFRLYVAVEARGHQDVLVAETPSDGQQIDAVKQRQRGRGVPQDVERKPWCERPLWRGSARRLLGLRAPHAEIALPPSAFARTRSHARPMLLPSGVPNSVVKMNP
jgi:hypothetical protein